MLENYELEYDLKILCAALYVIMINTRRNTRRCVKNRNFFLFSSTTITTQRASLVLAESLDSG